VLPLIGLCGVLLGAAECLYHHTGPPPIGHLRQNGASWLGITGLQALLFLLPAALMIFVQRVLRGVAWRRSAGVGQGALFALWLAALLPTLWVDLDYLARFSHWPLLSYHHATLFAWECFLIALVVTLAAAILAATLSRLWLRWTEARVGKLLGITSVSVALVVLMGAALFSLRAPAPRQNSVSADASSPNLLLFTVDTLREDAVGVYGGPDTPGFDAWISQGVRCEGFSCAPWTRPSFASLFSGVAPTGHGANRDRGVSPEVSWWPEIFEEHGWHTRAYVSNPHLEAGLGFARGFDFFDHAGHLEGLESVEQMIWVRTLHRHLQERLERGDRIIAKAVKWLRQPDPQKGPWLLWVHVIDPHLPYHLRGPRGELHDAHPGRGLACLAPFLSRGAVRDLGPVRSAIDTLSEEQKSALHELYRREVAFLDRQVTPLLQAAQNASVDRPLLWVLASDHGEEFFEHGGFEHGHTLYGELLRVPLAFGGLDLPEHASAAAMKLSDVGPTVLALCKLPPMPLRGMAINSVDSTLAPYVFGQSRSRELREAEPDANGEASASSECAPPRLLAEDLLYGPPRTRFIFPGGEGLLRDDESLEYSRIDACGSDAETDSTLSAGDLNQRERALLDALDRWRHEASKVPHEAIHDPALRERLRSLGYVN